MCRTMEARTPSVCNTRHSRLARLMSRVYTRSAILSNLNYRFRYASPVASAMDACSARLRRHICLLIGFCYASPVASAMDACSARLRRHICLLIGFRFAAPVASAMDACSARLRRHICLLIGFRFASPVASAMDACSARLRRHICLLIGFRFAAPVASAMTRALHAKRTHAKKWCRRARPGLTLISLRRRRCAGRLRLLSIVFFRGRFSWFGL